jgi:hypothetical protein
MLVASCDLYGLQKWLYCNYIRASEHPYSYNPDKEHTCSHLWSLASSFTQKEQEKGTDSVTGYRNREKLYNIEVAGETNRWA